MTSQQTVTNAARRLWVFATYLVAAGIAALVWALIAAFAPTETAGGHGPTGPALLLALCFLCYMGYAVRHSLRGSLADLRKMIGDDDLRALMIRSIVREAWPWGLVLGAGAGMLGFKFGDVGTLAQIGLFLLLGIWVDAQETRAIRKVCKPVTGSLWT